MLSFFSLSIQLRIIPMVLIQIILALNMIIIVNDEYEESASSSIFHYINWRNLPMDNNACIGYALIACKMLGMTHREINELEATLHSVLDRYTEEEAVEAYKKN